MDFTRASTIVQERQDSSGGWSFQAGAPSTELTAFCLLALRAASGPAAAVRRGEEWLRSVQRSDGGWPPYPRVAQSTWLTALAVHSLSFNSAYEDQRGVNWLTGQTGRESTFVHRLRSMLLGGTQVLDDGVAGWPWYPGTAAWVVPSCHSLLALSAIQRRGPRKELAERMEQGRRFLLARVCHDGGWNHGSTSALGYDSDSYPETTGLALAALHGSESTELAAGIAAARKHMPNCRSLNGLAWLAVGLRAHGETVPADLLERAPCRDTLDAAMFVLASAAIGGKNAMVEGAG